jgi:putative transcriptional regulator
LAKECDDVKLACFLGHSGWSPGQLEDELDETAWLVSSLDHELFLEMGKQQETWKKIVGGMSQELRLLVEAPVDPTHN